MVGPERGSGCDQRRPLPVRDLELGVVVHSVDVELRQIGLRVYGRAQSAETGLPVLHIVALDAARHPDRDLNVVDDPSP